MAKVLSWDTTKMPQPRRGQMCAINVFANWNTAVGSGEFAPAKVSSYPNVFMATPVQLNSSAYPDNSPKLYYGQIQIPQDCPNPLTICVAAVDGSGNDWGNFLSGSFPVSG